MRFGVTVLHEAEARFGKRPEVRDSYDRYANLEIGVVSRRMEKRDGVAVLATTEQANIDCPLLTPLGRDVM